MDYLGLAVYADMGLHTEVPLVALPGLVHLRVSGLIFIFGGAGSVYNSGINYGARTDLQPVLGKVLADENEKLFAEIMGLKNVTELAYCRLIGSGFPAKVDTDKVTHGAGIIKGSIVSQSSRQGIICSTQIENAPGE